ncbi:MAG: 2-dehydropantoate 2-reductase [Halomonas sp.]|jgi:2-dehydropantoate 2-reductase|uniref:2-dehydropantoate 2-reductase n=1 Tax=Billgrantia tianxiuensis TaxID=2497861 RepID=A0A6I6SSY1_9GAMM|nr:MULTISPECIES: 2-dehydropantoate 2-reductase [Halomonas]MCE8035639.1 2-dehydropantoate 2-reductase [Halomonas sp. MCCC 1A11057]MDX5433646.1 2-dehydropantoate 2-reductase [Halomonas sp.]MDX5503288.1 2-dehydropantoate 2-reductase [Halomonas sp.]QHC50755.1 2-dehydropantoate 2-reductase [Halomonas tianxiuensis]
MKFAIMGSGGVGGYFGARLAEAGEDVTFIARGEHLAAMQRQGLRVSSIKGDVDLAQVKATEDPATLGEVDCVIVAVKAWQVREAAESIRPLVGPDTLVLPLENGVEAADILAEVLGEAPVLDGLCGILAWREAPGHIRHAGVDPFIRFGERDNHSSARTARLKAVFDKVHGVSAEIPDDIRVAQWSKFLFICAMSGIGSITRAPIGVTRQLPETRALIQAMLEEIDQVARAHGVAFPADAVARAMQFIDAMPAESTSSMQRNIMAGEPSELESQNGAVVRLGQAVGVATPVHGIIHAALLPQELAARGELPQAT